MNPVRSARPKLRRAKAAAAVALATALGAGTPASSASAAPYPSYPPKNMHGLKNPFISPDLLARDASGKVWRIGSVRDASGKNFTAAGAPVLEGGGWNAYDRIEMIGDVTPDGYPDAVARDRDGVLWKYTAKSKSYAGSFWTRTRIGGGWNTYTMFTGGSDVRYDLHPDLVAVDKRGDLYLYEGSGGAGERTYLPRRRIGHGWGIYDRITAVGDIGGAGAGDLVARDKDGVLWLYLGKGDGTFAPRTKIGGGWNAYDDVIGIGDADDDWRNDLYAYAPDGTGYLYRGNGEWKAPFEDRVANTTLKDSGIKAALVF
ncbi:hypothetical protein ABT154_16400 [Streptomyces sp. NPDC001728]|uniref:hypothetical protein n=1 Tax=Streptomyces sp. NPDC001728 TaxID=3154396 RepID=UPI003326C0BC